jgi:hypothetical protein
MKLDKLHFIVKNKCKTVVWTFHRGNNLPYVILNVTEERSLFSKYVIPKLVHRNLQLMCF